MNLIEFIRQYATDKNEYTTVVLEWYWNLEGIDEEFCFEGKPSEFIKRYTEDYDCIDDYDIFDVQELKIVKAGCFIKIYIEIVSD